VEGAEIEFVWMHVYPEGSFKTNAVSDAAGLFLLRGVKGAKLGVHVSKAGYRLIRSLNQESFGYSSAPGFEPFHPDPNNPVTFHLRKGE